MFLYARPQLGVFGDFMGQLLPCQVVPVEGVVDCCCDLILLGPGDMVLVFELFPSLQKVF